MASREEWIEKAVREAEIPPPRELRLRPIGENWGFWLRSLIPGAFILFIVGISIYRVGIPFLAERYGQPAQAQIVNMWVHQGRGNSYSVQVIYKDGPNMPSANIGVNSGVYSRLKIGDKVGIHYFHAFPNVPSLDDSPKRLPGVLFPLVIWIAIAGSALPLALFRQRMFLARGRMARGRVENYTSKRMKAKFEHEGQEYTASAPGYYYGRKGNVGDPVVVLYDPDHPKKNMVFDPSNCIWAPRSESQF